MLQKYVSRLKCGYSLLVICDKTSFYRKELGSLVMFYIVKTFFVLRNDGLCITLYMIKISFCGKIFGFFSLHYDKNDFYSRELNVAHYVK